ncbi:MAG TPA: response regulator transcription factor [Planctomycetota bacterium]|nr:response regulator transcription factor [Planctomycetota bacterium]
MSSAARVAVVDDEEGSLRALAETLRAGGYSPETYRDAGVALDRMRRNPPSIVLLDVLLRDDTGHGDGREVCRAIRADPVLARLPVILVTGAAIGALDESKGLDVGADDYIRKPWTAEVLLARLGAVLRRTRGLVSAGPMAWPGLEIDPRRHLVTVSGRLVPLTPTETQLLWRLASDPGRAWSRDDLLGEAASEREIEVRNVDVHVMSIRRKLGTLQSVVQTVHRVGYRFVPPA